MTVSTSLWPFALIVGLLTLTPGLDTALILRTAALGRRRSAWGVALGIQDGTLVWGALTSLGATALLTAAHIAYEALRWAGAAYLVWMGARMLAGTFRRSATDGKSAEPADGHPVTSGSDTIFRGFRQSLMTNLLNPKVGAFYTTVLPQFIAAGTNYLVMGVLLASVHVALGLAWSTALVAFARRLRGWLRTTRARRLLDRVAGAVIAAFGIRLALGD
ncbi:LysE family translocator [Nonomuraea sp. NPDC046802]|uniref:LysE family translocator n=1 Tax=Nonomuraea sp. NPDC046802 TaxID=3154919 RepID=UPI0033F86A02